jgi:hypothetical protein
VDNVAGAVPGATGGIYTGNEQGTAPAAATGAAVGAPNNIEQLLGQLAASLGMPIEQLRAFFPANLMPAQASNEAIANSPVLKMLRGEGAVNSFNTGPQTGSPFTNIAAPTGGGTIETGIRGGQDVNATQFLTANPATQQQIQGVLQASKQYFPDFQQQLLRSAPLTNTASGSFGRRTFQ